MRHSRSAWSQLYRERSTCERAAPLNVQRDVQSVCVGRGRCGPRTSHAVVHSVLSRCLTREVAQMRTGHVREAIARAIAPCHYLSRDAQRGESPWPARCVLHASVCESTYSVWKEVHAYTHKNASIFISQACTENTTSRAVMYEGLIQGSPSTLCTLLFLPK